jgi:hypothetical protein
VKCISITFMAVYLFIAVLTLLPALGALQNVPLHNSSKKTYSVLNSQRLRCPADLPSEIKGKIVRHMQRADYDIHSEKRKLPSGQDSLYSAFNRNQNMDCFFTHDGVHLLSGRKDDPERYLEMKLSAYGYTGAMKKTLPVQPVDIYTSGHRIEYRRKILTEWYVNNENGLEQGIILNQPPVAQHKTSGSLIVEWEIKSSLIPMLEQTEKSIAFCQSKNKKVLHYSGLKAWDANGRMLPTKLALRKPKGKDGVSRIAFLLDDRNASYPITIDPVFSLIKKLVRLDHAWGANYGESVAIDGDVVAVGGPLCNKDNDGSTGAVYIYYRNRGGLDNWGQVRKVVGLDSQSSDYFGKTIALDGDILVVEAAGDNLGQGSVYIFERNYGGTDNWGQVKKINANGNSIALDYDTLVIGSYVFERNYGGADNWGQVKQFSAYSGSVGISGDTIALGVYLDNDSGTNAGAAYIYERNAGGADNWGKVTKIKASDGAAEDRFGSAVAIDGDIVVVTAKWDDDNGAESGSAYVFERDRGGTDNWGEAKKIIASDGVADDLFGSSVCINGDIVVVGAFGKDSLTGAAYVFERDRGGTDNWGETRKITASDGDGGDSFGNSLCISGETIAVGANWDEENGWGSGSAYIFNCNQGGIDNWGKTAKLLPVAMGELPGNRFGISAAICDDRAVVGAYNAYDVYGSGFGGAYIFERDHGGTYNWGQFRRVGALSLGATGDRFGWSVGIWGDFVVVGAPYGDDNGSSSGSAYIFDRSKEGSDGWGYDLVKKITPSDGAASDYFGWSVAIFGDTVVVGAYGDDDLGSASGSVYIFERDEGGPDNWGQVKKLTAFDGAAGDEFGRSVSVFLDTVVVGACMDDDHGTNSGSAYIFDRNTGGFDQWGLEKKIFTVDIGAYDYFGYSVSVFLSNVLVGAYGDDDKGSGSGAAYLFSRDECGVGNWGQVKKILASDGAAGDAFGHAVSISFYKAVIGAFNDDDSGLSSGSAYTFSQDEGGAGNWGEVNKITASDGAANDLFGDAVAIFFDTVVVGAYQHDEYGIDSGAAYIFSPAPTVQPDLVVLSVVANPTSPEPGEPVDISVTVKNQGTGDADPFTIDWYADLTSPPSVSQTGDSFENMDSLAADATHVMNTTYMYSSAGNYNMYAQVDTQDKVEESEENNNVLGPVSLVVGACEGDFDGDGDVDGSALAIFAADFGRTDCNEPGALACEGDFDKDGDVDGSDLAVFAADFGRTDCPH